MAGTKRNTKLTKTDDSNPDNDAINETKMSNKGEVLPLPSMGNVEGNAKPHTTNFPDTTQLPTTNVSFDLQLLLRTVIQETVANLSQARSTVSTSTRLGSDAAVAQLIPEFDPKKDSLQTINDWLRKIDQYADMYEWSEKTIICYALPRLKGSAKTWYESLDTVQRSWNEWKLLLCETFPPTVGFQRLYNKMIERKRRHYESVEEYFHEKVALIRACHFDDSDAIEFVINGLGNPLTIQAVSVRDFVSLPELLKCLKRLEENAMAVWQPSGRYKPTHTLNAHQTDDARPSTSRPKRRPMKNEAGEVLCFNCNDYGHLSKSCPKPQRRSRCFRCNRVGHMQSDCPQPESRSRNHATTDTTNEQAMHMTSVGQMDGNLKYFQDVQLEGNDVRAYIDLGSGCITLREDEAEKLNIKYTKPEQICSIGGYGDGRVYPVGVTECHLKVDQASTQVKVYIVPCHSQNIPLIVGQPFTENSNITIVKRKNFIRFFEEKDDQLEDNGLLGDMELPSLPKKTVTLWAKDATIIPPKYVGFVVVYTEPSNGTGNDLFVDRRERVQLGREHCVPCCIVSLDKDGTSAIPVMNTSSRDILIRQDECLVRAEPCVPEVQGTMLNTQLITDVDSLLPVDEVHMGPQLHSDQSVELMKLLQRYRDCFALSMRELGVAKDAQMTLELTSDTPVTYRPYRLSHDERGRVGKMVNELKECGIVEDSASAYASPVLVVKKKTGESRLCIDYRALNRVTKKDRFPLPLIDDQLERLQGQRYYTTLDMASGYHQIPMAESSRQYTAFVTPDGHYQFTRVPFGLANAPAVFQRAVNAALGPLRYSVALAYMDDVLIPSTTYQEGLEHLEQVLLVLRSAGLKLKLTKCRFLMEQIDFLGYEISAQGIRPGDYKIASVRSFARPTNIHELRRFIGLTSYFRRFVKNFATHARPLTALLHKEVEFHWRPEQEGAFQYLRAKLSEKPVLAIYDHELDVELHTDASSEGLGVVLVQHREKNEHPIGYASRQTTTDEKRYHSYELETLAIVWGVEKYRPYLLGRDFTIVTDCNSVRDAFSKRDLVPRIARWWLKLQEYTFKIEHRPGTRMCHVDALSRAPWGKPEEMEVTDGQMILHMKDNSEDWLLMAQLSDAKVKSIIDELKGDGNKNSGHLKEYKLKDGRLFRIMVTDNGEELRWVVPDRARWQVVRRCHDDLGHFALDKTYERLCRMHWFPRMKRYVRRYISSCLECLYNKRPSGKRPGELHSIDKGSEPFHTLHIDHLGPFVRSTRLNEYLIVLVDGFTKYTLLCPVRSTRSTVVTKFLSEVVTIFGAPARVVTDQGTAFTGRAFEEYCREVKIVHIKNATSTPRANGQVERYNRTITPAIASLSKDPENRDWDKTIPLVQWGLNNTVHKATKCTPFSLLFNYVPRGISGDHIEDDLKTNMTADVSKRRQEAVENLRKDQEQQRIRYNSKRAKAENYQPGDLVLVERNPVATGQSLKLTSKYRGPYVVTQVLPNDTYRVEDFPEHQNTQRFYSNTVPVDKMKRWQVQEVDSSSDEECNEEEQGDDKITRRQPVRNRQKPKRFQD